MRTRAAALVLRLPFREGSQSRRQALATVLRAAASGAPAAVRARRSDGHETVWRLWLTAAVSGRSSRRWTSPELAKLLDAPVPDEAVDAAWRDWLREHDATLWSLLERWERPATKPRRRSLSLALDDGAPVDARVLAEAAARFDHPIGERARARLAARGDAETVALRDCLAYRFRHDLGITVAEAVVAADDDIEVGR